MMLKRSEFRESLKISWNHPTHILNPETHTAKNGRASPLSFPWRKFHQP